MSDVVAGRRAVLEAIRSGIAREVLVASGSKMGRLWRLGSASSVASGMAQCLCVGGSASLGAAPRLGSAPGMESAPSMGLGSRVVVIGVAHAGR